MEEYRDNKAAISLQRENLLKQLETAASEKTLTNEKQYETEIRHSLKSIIQMIENNPDRYIEIGNALREHVSQIVYDKEKDHGDYNDTLIDTANACGYYPIQWDVDTPDIKAMI